MKTITLEIDLLDLDGERILDHIEYRMAFSNDTPDPLREVVSIYDWRLVGFGGPSIVVIEVEWKRI